MNSLAVTNATSVVPFDSPVPVRGESFKSMGVLEEAAVVCDADTILSVGEPSPAHVELDASGCTVVPGFVDCHTHLPFHGWRAGEDAARLSGLRYEELHREEVGIYRSARMLAQADADEVVGFSRGLALAMLEKGTTTFEMKSGYGLSLEGELRQLRLARRLAGVLPQTVVTTCLAAHAVPPGIGADGWVSEVVDELLPRIAEEGLATACDIYVESIAFSLDHAARLADAAKPLGLRMRTHADQFADGGTSAFAAQRGFATADHLNYAPRGAVDDLARSETVAVLLPGATFTLRQRKRAPARTLIERGAIVALGTDLNPGTSPIRSMPFVFSLACRLYGLRPLEALAAATVNSAFALGLEERVGKLVPGYRADLVVLEGESFDHVPYRPDHDPVLAVVCGGELVHLAERARSRLRTH